MKKYLMTAVAALTFGGLMTSCTHDVDGSGSSGDVATNAQESYEQAFLNTFGRPVDGFDWGFGSGNNSTVASTRAMTRAIATKPNKPTFRDGVKNGDNVVPPITKPDVPTFYKTFEEVEAAKIVYAKDVEWNNGWDAVSAAYIDEGCNTLRSERTDGKTFYVNGNVRYWGGVGNGNNNQPVTFVVLEGSTLHLGCVGLNMRIYLAEGATLDVTKQFDVNTVYNPWPQEPTVTVTEKGWETFTLASANAFLYLSKSSNVVGNNLNFFNGCTIMNEGGTITADKLNIDKNTTLWNDGTVDIEDEIILMDEDAYIYNANNNRISVSKLSLINNTDLLYNDGTVIVSDDITMKNTGAEIVNNDSLTCSGNLDMEAGGAFHNVGDAVITGSTLIYNTNSRWMNDGHYTTGTFKDYNCEQVYNNCYMTVLGNFSLGVDAADVGKGGHAYFVMEGGEGENVSGAYVRCDSFSFADCADLFLGNKAFIEVNNSFEATNRNSDYGTHGPASGSYAVIKAASFTKVGNPYISMTYYGKLFIDTPIHYPKGTTQAEPYYVVYDESVQFSFEVQEKPVSIPKTGCSPGYNSNGTPPDNPVTPVTDKVRVIAEDLTTLDGKADFDFNDVVFDVDLLSSGKVRITLLAAGGTLPLTVGDQGQQESGDYEPTMEMQYDSQDVAMGEVMAYEVHHLFKVATTTMVNTNAAGGANRDAVEITIDNPSTSSDILVIANAIPIRVYKNSTWIELEQAVPVGTRSEKLTASKVAVDGTFQWCAERVSINKDTRYQYSDYKGTQKSRFELYLDGKLGAKWWDQSTVATD